LVKYFYLLCSPKAGDLFLLVIAIVCKKELVGLRPFPLRPEEY